MVVSGPLRRGVCDKGCGFRAQVILWKGFAVISKKRINAENARISEMGVYVDDGFGGVDGSGLCVEAYDGGLV